MAAGVPIDRVQVVVRLRPLSQRERDEGRTSIIDIDTALLQVGIRNLGRDDHPPKAFTYDAVYDVTTTQRQFYEESCYDVIEGVMEGYNGTIFAYGQTGCGKTHTMQGYNDPPDQRGVVPLAFDHVFENIKVATSTTFLVRCSYLEIYNEEIRDLLGLDSKKKLELKEDPNKGVYAKDLCQVIVSDQAAINRLMGQGQQNRTVGSTLMNQTSSRSHSIFTIVVEMNDVGEDGKEHIRVGKLNLVDLAGSERQSKTGASGDRLKEGCKINLSLSALGNVISALVDGKGAKHVPYRDSKLTRLLQDSLGGNTKTLMVAAISPADNSYEETLSTLRYANRAKNIKNKARINEDPKDAMLRSYKEEIERLRQALEQQATVAAAARFLPQAEEADQKQQQQRVADPVARAAEGAAAVAVPMPDIVVVEKVVVQQVEVVPLQLTAEKQALEDEKRAIEGQRDRLGEEVARERQAREELSRKLEELQQKLISATERRRQSDEAVSMATATAAAAAATTAAATAAAPAAGAADQRASGALAAAEAGAYAAETLALGNAGLKNGAQAPLLGLSEQGAATAGSAALACAPEGASEGEDPEVAIARQNAERRRMQARLRAKKKEAARLEAERQRALDEKAEVERELQDAVGVAEEKEKKLVRSRRRLERRLAAARDEIDDLTAEFEREREELLATVREQNRELQLWEQVARMVLPTKEISRIWERAEYNEEEEAWILPRIRPRSSFANEGVRLPVLTPVGGGGGGVSSNANSGSGGGGASGSGSSSRGEGGSSGTNSGGHHGQYGQHGEGNSGALPRGAICSAGSDGAASVPSRDGRSEKRSKRARKSDPRRDGNDDDENDPAAAALAAAAAADWKAEVEGPESWGFAGSALPRGSGGQMMSGVGPGGGGAPPPRDRISSRGGSRMSTRSSGAAQQVASDGNARSMRGDSEGEGGFPAASGASGLPSGPLRGASGMMIAAEPPWRDGSGGGGGKGQSARRKGDGEQHGSRRRSRENMPQLVGA